MPSAIQIVVVVSLVYIFWGTIPILTAGFIKNQRLRFSIVIVIASFVDADAGSNRSCTWKNSNFEVLRKSSD